MSMSVSTVSGRKKRRRLFLLQLFIVIGLVALIWFSFGQNVLAPQKQVGVPERLGGMELVGSIEGPEALAQIDRLHGTDINLVAASVATYADSGNERVTVWVGSVETSDGAAELTMIMAKGIAEGNPEFGNLLRLTVSDHEVFQVEGPGSKHFFYQSQKSRERVVWLAIEAANTMPILEQAVETF